MSLSPGVRDRLEILPAAGATSMRIIAAVTEPALLMPGADLPVYGSCKSSARLVQCTWYSATARKLQLQPVSDLGNLTESKPSEADDKVVVPTTDGHPIKRVVFVLEVPDGKSDEEQGER